MIRRDMDFLRVTVELASPVHGPSLGAGAGECNTTPCCAAPLAVTYCRSVSADDFLVADTADTPVPSTATSTLFVRTTEQHSFGVENSDCDTICSVIHHFTPSGVLACPTRRCF